MWICVCVRACSYECRCLQRSEASDLREAVLAESCFPPEVSTGNCTWVECNNTIYSYWWATSSSLFLINLCFSNIFKASCVWHLHICVYIYLYIFMYVNVGSLILWPVYRDQRPNSGTNLDLLSCLRNGLVCDHNTPRVSNLSDLTSWSCGAQWKGDIVSSLLSPGYVAQEVWENHHCFLGVLGLQILTLHVWLNVGSGDSSLWTPQACTSTFIHRAWWFSAERLFPSLPCGLWKSFLFL